MNTQWTRVLIWLFSCWMLSPTALADGYNKGLDAFKDGEYSKAYKILSGVVKKADDKTEKAEAMALMGAAAAKMGKKSKAKSLFGKAIKLDSDVSLSKDAVKDKSVRKLFAKVKKGSGGDEDEDSGGSSSGGGGEDDDGFGEDKADKDKDKDKDKDSEKSEKSEKSAKSGGSVYKGLVPLGIGFLLAGEVGRGLIYGGAQAAGLVGLLYYGNEITKANKDADAIGQQAIQTGGTPDPGTLAFLDQNEAFVKSAQANQKLMAAVFLGGFAVGAADGFLFGGKAKKSKKRSEIPSVTDRAWASTQSAHPMETEEEEEEEPRLWDMKLHLLPQHDPALMLSINRSF